MPEVENRLRIGVDLGGTKTEIIALDTSGTELHRKRVPTPAHDYDAILANIRALVLEAEQRLGATASVGVGAPGAVSPATNRIRNSNTACLNGRALDADLGRLLGREVRVANDANCFALSEAVDGAGRGHDIVFGAILGTGVGGGVVVSRSVLHGKHGIAGEWGHNPLPWPLDAERPGPRCYCGKQGCIETFLSGPGLSRDYERACGDGLPAVEIARRLRLGEPHAQAALERYVDRLARALASVINVLDPDAIVLGGGVSQIDLLYRELPRRLGAYVFSDVVTTAVAPAAHGDSSGVRGAAWLWPSTLH